MEILNKNNGNTSLDENKCYFMYKDNVLFADWFENINTLYIKIDMNVKCRNVT